MVAQMRVCAKSLMVKEIMQHHVLVVRQDMTLHETAKLFLDSQISGSPVVDAAGKMVGVISQTDVVRSERETGQSIRTVPDYYVNAHSEGLPRGLHLEAQDDVVVGDVMTPVVFTAPEEATLRDVAELMLARHIHRVIIVRDDTIRGIVTSMDMLWALIRST